MPDHGDKPIIMSKLEPADQDRLLDFLVMNKVDFVPEIGEGTTFSATVGVKQKPVSRLMIPQRPQALNILNSTGRSSTGSTKRSSTGSESPSQSRKARDFDRQPSFRNVSPDLVQNFLRFCRLLPNPAQAPKLMGRNKLLDFVNDVYNARYQADALVLHKVNFPKRHPGSLSARQAQNPDEFSLPEFPRFVFGMTKKRYGASALVGPICWCVVNSAYTFRTRDEKIEVFARFLSETYDSTDLLFFLYLRNHAERYVTAAPQGTVGENLIEKHWSAPKLARNSNARALPPGGGLLTSAQCATILSMVLVNKQDIQEAVLDKLAMHEESLDGSPNGRATIEVSKMLAIALDEFHSRRVEYDPRLRACGFNGEKTASISGTSNSIRRQEWVTEESKKVAAALMQSMRAMGETINTEEVMNLAMKVARRRVVNVDFSKDDEPANNSMERRDADAVLLKEIPTDEDLEKNLEETVHFIMVRATAEMVKEVMDEKDEVEGDLQAAIEEQLIEEFSLAADSLMEALVTANFPSWSQQLDLDADNFDDADEQIQQNFEKLRISLQSVLSGNVNVDAVLNICRTMLRTESVQARFLVRVTAVMRDPPSLNQTLSFDGFASIEFPRQTSGGSIRSAVSSVGSTRCGPKNNVAHMSSGSGRSIDRLCSDGIDMDNTPSRTFSKQDGAVSNKPSRGGGGMSKRSSDGVSKQPSEGVGKQRSEGGSKQPSDGFSRQVSGGDGSDAMVTAPSSGDVVQKKSTSGSPVVQKKSSAKSPKSEPTESSTGQDESF